MIAAPSTVPVTGQARLASTGPRSGDVVVAREAGDGLVPLRFVVRQVPGTAQVSWPSREQALHAASTFARRERVDVWIADERDGGEPRRHHPVASDAGLPRVVPRAPATRESGPRPHGRWTPPPSSRQPTAIAQGAVTVGRW